MPGMIRKPSTPTSPRSMRFSREASAATVRWAVGLSAAAVTLIIAAPERAQAQTPAPSVKDTRVTPGEANRVFVMAGFKPDACAFIGFPEMDIQAPPARGQVSFKQGEATTIQYSLSGKCIGTVVQGTGIYYTPAPGQSGTDTFTVSGRLGNGEPATRTFSVIIDENGNVQ